MKKNPVSVCSQVTLSHVCDTVCCYGMFVALEMLAVAVDSRLVGSDLKARGALQS